jgi:Flp pilus assembly protein CpaB
MELTRKRPRGVALKGLLATRQGTLLVALVCAVAAAVIIAIAISDYRNSISTSNAQATVLVSKGLIQKGTSGAAIAASGLYTPTRMIGKNISVGAITDAAALQGKVAVSDILPGQQLTLADFAVGTGVATVLASNERALSVPLDSSHGLSGVVQIGDHVDVYAGFNVQGANGGAGPVLRLLLPDVPVLSAPSTGTNGGNVVLGVNANDAAELAYASDNGKIWLVLRPGNAENATQTAATIQSILLGQPPILTGSGRKP